MDGSRLARLAFLESVRLAALPSRSAVRSSWASQVAALLPVSPIQDSQPQRIDVKATLTALQNRYLASVAGSAQIKVQLYVGQIAPPLSVGTYKVAPYIEGVASRSQLRNLANLRTGSHRLRVETGRWERPAVRRDQRLCQRCDLGEVDDEHHMVFRCTALQELRQQHARLFGVSGDLRSFLAQEPAQVAAFVAAGFVVVAEQGQQ